MKDKRLSFVQQYLSTLKREISEPSERCSFLFFGSIKIHVSHLYWLWSMLNNTTNITTSNASLHVTVSIYKGSNFYSNSLRKQNVRMLFFQALVCDFNCLQKDSQEFLTPSMRIYICCEWDRELKSHKITCEPSKCSDLDFTCVFTRPNVFARMLENTRVPVKWIIRRRLNCKPPADWLIWA